MCMAWLRGTDLYQVFTERLKDSRSREYEVVGLLLSGKKKTTRTEAQSNTAAMEEGNFWRTVNRWLISLEFPSTVPGIQKHPEKSNDINLYTIIWDRECP